MNAAKDVRQKGRWTERIPNGGLICGLWECDFRFRRGRLRQGRAMAFRQSGVLRDEKDGSFRESLPSWQCRFREKVSAMGHTEVPFCPMSSCEGQ
jgi:hypothetical protein